jgi:hypothetical protein
MIKTTTIATTTTHVGTSFVIFPSPPAVTLR